MSKLACDGIIQTTPATDIENISTANMIQKLGANGAHQVKDSSGDVIHEIDKEGNTTIKGDLTVQGNTIAISPTEVLIGDSELLLNKDIDVVSENNYGGIAVKRVAGAASFTTASFVNAINTINMTDDPTSQLAIGDLFFLSGTENNDGLYKVSTINSTTIVIDTEATERGVKTSLVDETIAGEINESIHSYFNWNEANDLWEFGWYEVGGIKKTYKMIGIGEGGANIFSDTNPDISAYGTNSTNSAATKIGINPTNINNSSNNNLQSVLEDLDSAIAGAEVTFGLPALVLGTTNAVGSTDEAIRRDSSIAIFDDGITTTIQPDDAAAPGSQSYAARRDHRHAINTDTPIDIGSANQEGDSTSFARANHAHNINVADGPKIKSGQTALANGDSSKAISFTTAFTTSCTMVNVTIENTGAGTKYHFTLLITARSTTGFTVELSGATNSADYKINWTAFGA